MLNAFRYGEASDDIFAFGYLVLAFFLSVSGFSYDISQNGYWICMVVVIVIAMLMIPITVTINRFISKEIENFKAGIYE